MGGWGVHGARGAFQGIVESLMRTLLEDHPALLTQTDVTNLTSPDFCKGVLGLHIANFALLRHRSRGHMIQGHARYWKHVYAEEFYVCSQWWKDHHRSNARALSAFASKLAARRPAHPGASELRRHIEALDDVAAAHVTLVVPERELFAEDQLPTTASIVITPRQGSGILDDHQRVLGIQRLVQFAVAGLSAEHIVILDPRGVQGK